MENKTIAQAGAASVSDFLSKVFLWMAVGLAVTTAGSFWLLSQPQLFAAIMKNQWVFFALIIAQFGLVIWLSAKLMSMSTRMATTLFLVYSFLTGVTLSPIFVIYTGASVVNTFAVTAGTFFFFSLYGFTTKRDLTTMGGLMTMGLIGIILASVINMFVKSSMLNWIMTFVGIAVFMGLIAWDTQKLKALHAMGFESHEAQRKMTIRGALMLYLDFLNLFILLLKIFGKRRN